MQVHDLYPTAKKNRFAGRIWTMVTLIAMIAIVSVVSGIYLELIQWNEIGGFSSVFVTNFIYKAIFSVGAFVIMFMMFFFTTVFARKNIKQYLKDADVLPKKLPKVVPALIISLLGALASKEFFYQKALMFLNNVSFKENAPLINLDIGYFIFQRPFLMSVYEFVSTAWVFVIIYTVAYYFLGMIYSVTGSLEDMSQVDNRIFKIRTVIRHNLINLAIFFFIKAFSYKFQREGILFSKVVDVDGASYVDVNIWMKYYYFVPFLLIAIVIMSLILIWKGHLRKSAYTIAIFPAVWIVFAIIASITQTFFVKPNQFDYEKKYVQYNMEKTREAYGIDKVKTVNFQPKELTPEVVNRNKDTIDNIRVIDYKSTLENNVQLQNVTNFYTFNQGDIINYQVNGKNIPVFITAREIDKTKLSSMTEINSKFKYTHGYGAVINPINKIIPGGQVDFILSDMNDKRIKRPEIYYGELTNDQVVVNAAGINEIDYDSSKETRYKGAGGIKLSLLNKLLFAAKYGDLNMLVSSYIDENAKILLNRDIIQRTQKVFPFLNIDEDPYIVIGDDGRLKWIIDAYTTTNNYPFSQSYGEFNYIRNSVKIIVDAYDGTTTGYIVDESDPLIQVYAKIYKNILKPKSLFPKDLEKYSKYPETLFKIQTEMLRRYHLAPEKVSDFFTKQDMWDISKHYSKNVESTGFIDPYYTMVKLPGVSSGEEFILMRPFAPSNKENMAAWLAVRNSFDNYGNMVLYRFPQNINTFGTQQIGAKINQQDEISKDMSLWGSTGSSVYKGDLIVVPLEDSILYVEPIYVKASGEKTIPEVKKIVASYQKGGEFIYGSGLDLQSALNSLFKGALPKVEQVKATPNDQKTQPPVQANANDKEQLIKEITVRYDALKKELDNMGQLIGKLK